MSTLTTNYKLVKPAASDKYDISVMNNNFDTLDSTLKTVETRAGDGIVNNLTSTSTTNSLSAAQGKILNDKFAQYFLLTEGQKLNDKFASYLPLSGGTLTGCLNMAHDRYIEDGVWGLDMKNSDIVGINGLYCQDPANSHDEGLHYARSDGNWDTLRGYESRLYWCPNRPTGSNVTQYEVNTEFQPGDTYSIVLPDTGPGSIGGCISNSNTELRFVLLLHRGLSKISTVTVNTLKLNIRHANGGYIGPTASVTGGYDFKANYTVTASKCGDNAVNICIKGSGFGYTNNCPISIEPNNIKLTFS